MQVEGETGNREIETRFKSCLNIPLFKWDFQRAALTCIKKLYAYAYLHGTVLGKRLTTSCSISLLVKAAPVGFEGEHNMSTFVPAADADAQTMSVGEGRGSSAA